MLTFSASINKLSSLFHEIPWNLQKLLDLVSHRCGEEISDLLNRLKQNEY